MTVARVLVVDDEPGLRDFASDALSASGHAVTTAQDGAAALEALEGQRFDVMVTDLRMPNVDGMALLRRARTTRPEMEIIVLTAFGSVNSAVEALKLGAFDYIEKPIASPDALRHLVAAAAAMPAKVTAAGAMGFAPDTLRALLETQGIARGSAAEARAALQAELKDRYRFGAEIGQGGTATVHLAEDLRFGRTAAIKVMRPELASSDSGNRFLREIMAAAQVVHPYVVPLWDCGVAAGLLYYVMPYVAGGSLRMRLERERRLSESATIRIARELGDALDWVHGAGLLHRDLKPENVLFSDGHAMLADFGLAKALAPAGDGTDTEPGIAVGTPHYMSPEQVTGAMRLDRRSDVYSLACVVFEMLAARPPFTGGSPQAIMFRHLMEDAPPLAALRPDLSPHVAGAVARALSKAPDDRFATASAFVEALGAPAAEH